MLTLKKALKLITLCVSLTPFISGLEAKGVDPAWAVMRTEETLVTSLELKSYIENVIISDEMRSSLFKKSGYDIDQFEQEKEKIIKNIMPEALKRMAFVRFTQHAAIKNQDRRFFGLTKKQFNRIVNERVKKILQNQIEYETFDKLVADLKQGGFPHSSQENDQEIYSRWLKRLKVQLREEIREKEAFKFICALGDCKKDSPLAIFRANKKLFNRHFLMISPAPHEQLRGEKAIDYVLSREFSFITAQSEKDLSRRNYYFIGKVIDQKVEFMIVNDHDFLTGSQLRHLGYPVTDDFGRTSGLMLNYTLNHENGNITVSLENWLFAQQIDSEDRMRQHLEEVATLRVASRQFLDDKGNTWLILGVSAHERTQTPAFHSWLQNLAHTIDKTSSPRIYIGREDHQVYLEAMLGIGGKYSIMKNRRVDISVSGEVLLTPTIGLAERSRITASSSIDANYFGKNNQDYPRFFASLFGNYSLLINGEQESKFGGKIGFGGVYKNLYLQINLFVIRWDEDLDRVYEGEASWTTGLAISATFIDRKKKEEFEFN